MTDFSIIIPTRGRPKHLKELVQSIWDNASGKYSYDITVGLDSDDKTVDQIDLFGLLTFYQREQQESLIEGYINPMAKRAKGKYVWFLADDCVVMTKDWDKVAMDLIDRDLFWGDVYDSTWDFEGVGKFSGFPIISKEAIKVLGFYFHPKIHNWGADKYTHYIYEKAGCLIDMRDIKVKHKRITEDETSRHIQTIYQKYGSGSDLRFDEEINILKGAHDNRRAAGTAKP